MNVVLFLSSLHCFSADYREEKKKHRLQFNSHIHTIPLLLNDAKSNRRRIIADADWFSLCQFDSNNLPFDSTAVFFPLSHENANFASFLLMIVNWVLFFSSSFSVYCRCRCVLSLKFTQCACVCVCAVRFNIEAASILYGIFCVCACVCVCLFNFSNRENDPKSQIQYGVDASSCNRTDVLELKTCRIKYFSKENVAYFFSKTKRLYWMKKKNRLTESMVCWLNLKWKFCAKLHQLDHYIRSRNFKFKTIAVCMCVFLDNPASSKR